MHLENSILVPVEISTGDTKLLHISSKESHLRRKLKDIKTELTILSNGEISTYKTINLLPKYYKTGGDPESVMNYFDEKESLSNARYILMKNSSQRQVVRLNIPKIPVRGGEPHFLKLIYKTSPFEEGKKGFFSSPFSLIYKISKTLSSGYLPDMSIGMEFINVDNKVLKGETIYFNEFIDTTLWKNLEKNFIAPQGAKEVLIYIKLESNINKLWLKDLRLYPRSSAAEAEKEMKLIDSIQSLLNENLILKEKNLINLIDEILVLLEKENYREEDLKEKINFLKKQLLRFEEEFNILSQSESLKNNKDIVRALWRFKIIESIIAGITGKII